MHEDRTRGLEADVAGLSSRVDAVQAAVERNGEATAGLQKEVSRLRGEINGTLPRIDRNVERLFDLPAAPLRSAAQAGKLDEHNGMVHACRERTEVPACAASRDAAGRHQNEMGALFGALGSKADARSNEEAHSRLWLFLRLSLLAIATAAVGAVVVKALAF